MRRSFHQGRCQPLSPLFVSPDSTLSILATRDFPESPRDSWKMGSADREGSRTWFSHLPKQKENLWTHLFVVGCGPTSANKSDARCEKLKEPELSCVTAQPWSLRGEEGTWTRMARQQVETAPGPPCPFPQRACSTGCPGQAFLPSLAPCRGHTCHLSCGDPFHPHLHSVVLVGIGEKPKSAAHLEPDSVAQNPVTTSFEFFAACGKGSMLILR